MQSPDELTKQLHAKLLEKKEFLTLMKEKHPDQFEGVASNEVVEVTMLWDLVESLSALKQYQSTFPYFEIEKPPE